MRDWTPEQRFVLAFFLLAGMVCILVAVLTPITTLATPGGILLGAAVSCVLLKARMRSRR